MAESDVSLDALRKIADACPLAVIAHRLDDPNDDRTFRIVFANRNTEAHLRVKPSEVVGHIAEDLFPGIREQGFIARLVRVLATGQADDYEDYHYADERVMAVFAGHIERLDERTTVTWFENVTRRKELEREAARVERLEEESKSRIAMLAEIEAAHRVAEDALDTYELSAAAADEALWEIKLGAPGDPVDGTTPCRFSARFAEMIGIEEAAIRHDVQGFWDAIHPDDREGIRRAFQDLLEKPSRRMVAEHRMVRSSGEVLFVQTSARAATDAEGRVRKVAGAVREITAQKEAERELLRRISEIERQESVIEALSAPILAVGDDVIALPIVGTLDGRRAEIAMKGLLQEISDQGVQFALIDLTGVEALDAATAEHVVRIAQAVGLLGAQAIVTGIQPAVAQTMVELGIDLNAIETRRNLRDGLRDCLKRASRTR